MIFRSIFKKFSTISFLITSLFVPFLASAHEVYVLDNNEIANDLIQPPLNLFDVAMSHGHQFILAALLIILAVICILGVSISRKAESVCNPILLKIKPYARGIAQITLGSALIASAYFGAIFGTELPIISIFGTYAHLVVALLYIGGLSILFGLMPRLGALLIMVIYIWAFINGEGVYMLSYLTYFGEAFFILLCGGYSVFKITSVAIPSFINALEKKKYFILRICFSVSLMYAAFYAKFIHGQLALNTVVKYQLTNYFPFDPLFIVLGAFLIEITIAVFYLLGFELRFTSLFFLTFLTMSLVFFGESIWPHIILIGTALAMFAHGYDEYSVERHWYKKGKREPVF